MAAKNRILLVEGNDDKHVLYSLTKAYDIPDCFEIRDRNSEGISGWKRIIEDLDVELDRSDLESLGILVDADENPVGRWHSIRDRLLGLGYSDTPVNASSDGTIVVHENKPTVGIWLMPNNEDRGMLEDFLAALIPDYQGNRLWQHVTESVGAIPREEVRFPDARKSKVLIHTWLAWQNEPGKPFGQAITANYLSARTAGSEALIQWLRRLFVDSPQSVPQHI